MERETIFALATAPGRAGVAIVRVSGPAAAAAAREMSGELAAPRMLVVRRIMDGEELLDVGMVVWFAEGASYTGEEMVEFHLHGGRAVVARVLDALAGRSGFRAAAAGEFTRRALDAGRMDLTQVEGLADLIDAETEAQRKFALRVAGGALADAVKSMRDQAIRILALIEASIDFADEEDAPDDVSAEVAAGADALLGDLMRLTSVARAGERLREGYRVAIVGAPNVGKSSLLNAIAGREAAITSPIAGTTRDVIEVACEIEGLPVVFIDTAGLRETQDLVESEGVSRAREVSRAADLRIFLDAPDVSEAVDDDLQRTGDLSVWAKADLSSGPGDYAVSAKTYEGVPALLKGVADRLQPKAMGSMIASRQRQYQRLVGSGEDVKAAIGAQSMEIAAENIRLAVRQLDEIIGIVDVEDVLDEIFSRFCIGK